MRKIFFFLIGMMSGCFLVACSQEEPVPGPDAPASAGMGKVRTVSEALAELDAVLDHLDAPTRSGGLRTYSLSHVAVAGGGAATRSDQMPVLPDTLAYVVNFDGGEGFAVLGAQRESAPVYAVTERGVLDPTKLDEAIAEAYARLTQQEVVPASDTRSNSEVQIREIGIDIVPKLLAQALVAESVSSGGIADWGNTPGPSPKVVETTYGNWTNTTKVGPWVKVKWDQGYPFNMHCPETNSTYKYLSGHRYVGCVMVALGQVLATNERPVNPSVPLPPPFERITYSWKDMKEISNYLNVESFYFSKAKDTLPKNRHLSDCADILATYLAYLGSEECCKAIYTEDKTSAFQKDAVETMKLLDPVFYKNARNCAFHDATGSIYTMLDNRKPVLIDGMEEIKDEDYKFGMETNGHAWVLDGYWARTRTKREVYDDGRVSITTQCGRMLHCNWGYQGKYDGYYEEKVFDRMKVICRDERIDCNTINSGVDINLSYYNNVVVY